MVNITISEKQGVCNVALRAGFNNKIFSVWGNGEACKDYIYIEDFCNIFFLLYRESVSNTVLNIGSGRAVSLNEILNNIKGLIPSFTSDYTEASEYDVSHFKLDISKLKKIIGDYDFIPFYKGIIMTLEWLENE